MSRFAFFPEQASSFAAQVDLLYFALIAVTTFFTVLISALILFFAVKYRRRPGNEIATETPEYKWLEVTWSLIPLVIGLVLFGWGTKLFLEIYHTDTKDAIQIFGVGKQWMWKFQHPDGRREINDLHVPIGQSVRMTLISQDVIHSFYVPAFRTKHDVLPMRYTTVWFKPIKAGVYHLFCAEYCGAEHSRMVGKVYAMEPADYQAWLASPPVEGGAARTTDFGGGKAAGVAAATNVSVASADPLSAAKALLEAQGCRACHMPDNEAIAPKLEGIFGTQQALATGGSAKADENYLRESILNPTAKVVKGYMPVMPPYAGILSEEQIVQIINYIKSTSGSGK
jgi:cytochrome c oxidase subunit II